MSPALLYVVEDNADNLLLVRALLARHYRLEEFVDAESALRAMKLIPPDLALIDISLPGMSGEELLRRIHADPLLCAIPAIALTAHDLPGQREKFLSAGFFAHISKPIIDEDSLFKAIEEGLETVN